MSRTLVKTIGVANRAYRLFGIPKWYIKVHTILTYDFSLFRVVCRGMGLGPEIASMVGAAYIQCVACIANLLLCNRFAL